MHKLTLVWFLLAVTFHAHAAWEYLDNGEVKIGVDLDRGACIGFFADSSTGRNLLNHYDTGRFVQQSYYGDPDGSIWGDTDWVYNPVQGGSAQGYLPNLLAFTNNAQTGEIYAKITPRNWAGGQLAPEASMEETISLNGSIAHIHFKLTYAGPTQARVPHQEMPAVFVDYDLPNLVFVKDGNLERRVPGWPNEYGVNSEQWMAYLDNSDWGIGILTPGTPEFTSYRYHGSGAAGSTGDACSYVAPIRTLQLVSGLVLEHDVYLTIGTLDEIRTRFSALMDSWAQRPYVFFDSFDISDSVNINTDISSRQTNGSVISPYNNLNTSSYSITGGKLHDTSAGGGINQEADFASHIVGNDFEFSFKVTQKETTANWGSVYMYDETAVDQRGDSRLGCLIWGAAQGTAFSLYSGVEAPADIYGVSVQELTDTMGTAYIKSEEHTIQFISHAGTDGSNTYDFVVDGFEIRTGIPYRFPGVERQIGMTGIPSALGIDYDDLYLKIIEEVTYAVWVGKTGLTEGVNDARTDDPELDGMDNLLEYALGGNPMVDDAASILPTAAYTVDTIEYVYRRRVDAVLRGLDYGLLINTDGLKLPWTNVGKAFETATGSIDFEFESVTNALPITGINIGFVNLQVTED